MGNLLRVEPTKSHLTGAPDGFAWYEYDDGRSYHRRIDAGEGPPRGPMIISDYIDAVVSMADGKTYESKSALAATYRPEGNPQGVRYECIGERVAEPYKRRVSSREERIQTVKRVLGDL